MAKKKEVPNTDNAKNTQKSSPAKKAPSNETKNKKEQQLHIDDAEKIKKLKKAKKEHVILKSMTPYIIMLVALILFICFFTVHILDLEDGAGVIGDSIQWFFCGLLGGAAFLLPFALFFIGLKWCLYNIKAKDSPKSEEASFELTRTKKRIVLQTVMCSAVVFLISVILGVFSDAFDSIEILDMWAEAAEDLVGGGALGGTFAVLMVMAFETVISTIILIALLAVAVVFMIGLTPDRIIVYIKYKNMLRKERNAAYKEECERQKEERELEEQKHRSRLESAELKKEKTHAKQDSKDIVDEILEENAAEEPLAEDTAENGIYIGPSRDENAVSGKIDVKELAKENEQDKNEINKGEDFGGDPVFDNPDFNGMSGLMNELKKKEPVNNTAEAPTENIDLSKMGNEELLSEVAAVAPDNTEEVVEVETPYIFPPMDMLEKNKNPQNTDFSEELQENAKKLMETLKSFKVSIKEITYSRGPTITRYELKPEAGIRVRSIANLVDDIALNLATTGVRIEAPIPNKPAVGIEVPNRERATVYLRDLIESPKFSDAKSRLTSSLGMDVGGNPIYFDIAKMPHLLIAGATGMGKSVCINSVIVSILYKAKPDEVKLILIDPKKVEFNIYKDIPHLYAPIVSDPKKAAGALASAVAEMERRFELIEEVGVRDIATYNAVTENDPDKEFMPQMVIIIDELADLMMTAPDEVESSICRLAQKARAAGIHIIIGTQRPSVDVITGLIKANIPSRIACTVASQIDSRTILDIAGAEKLIGRGDMLFAPVGSSKPMRVQGAFVSEAEVENIVTFIKENNSKAKYNADFISKIEEEAAKCGMSKKGGGASGGGADADVGGSDGEDSKFRDAVKLAIEEGKISTSLMQRRLGVGYGRAAKIIDTMEQMGYVSKPDGNKPRRVLITMDEYMRRVVNNDLGGEEQEEDTE